MIPNTTAIIIHLLARLLLLGQGRGGRDFFVGVGHDGE